MKKLILIILFTSCLANIKAQPIFEHSYTASVSMTQLSNSGYKYYFMDYLKLQCDLYNIDHSSWKTIPISIPFGMYLSTIKYVSDNLFNNDNKVELAYTYYSYDTSLFRYTYYTRVINEDGAELILIPGCQYIDIKNTSSSGTKMLAYIYDYSQIPTTITTMVYSLPGTLPGGLAPEEINNTKYPYPNPARNAFKIPYELPKDLFDADVQILDQNGTTIRIYKVDKRFRELEIQCADFPVGAILYRIVSGNRLLGSGQIIHE